MPEGDTVWLTARRLDRGLSGQVLTASDLRVPSLATVDLSGASVVETIARGKHLLTRLDSAMTLHSHLVMEGHWALHPVGTRWKRPAFQARAVLRTETTEAVGFDIRLDLAPTAEEEQWVGHLGPDLLGPDWDPEEAVRRLAADPDRPVGEALLDQANLAGIGNVYRIELCFLFGLHPEAPVSAVPDLRRLVDRAHQLLTANRERHDRTTTGNRARGQRMWVYGRRGPCLRCGTRIRYEHLGPPGRERPSYWCPSCQPAPS